MSEDAGLRLFGMEAAARSFGFDMIKYDDCAMWVVSELHPEGAKCPHCSEPVAPSAQGRYFRLEQIRCVKPGCKKKFTAATGTLLNGSKLEVREIYLLAVLSFRGVSIPQIADVLKCHVDTVTSWQNHFKAHREQASA